MFFDLSKYPGKKVYHKNYHKNMKQHISWAANQHIRMISEGSRDTEDWSKVAEKSALHHRKKTTFLQHIHIENKPNNPVFTVFLIK